MSRRRAERVVPVLAAAAVAGLLGAAAIAPMRGHDAAAAEPAHGAVGAPDAQTLDIVLAATAPAARGGFSAEPAPAPEPVLAAAAPPAAVPDPGTAQAIAADMVAAMGWDGGEFDCLVALWNRESGWSVTAGNPVSGAYGIPQALPGEKMASAGADWETNPATQIAWGLSYISGRYGTPCGAWQQSEASGWY